MRAMKWTVLLASVVLVGSPAAAEAQGDRREERRIARLMDRLREEMWSYRQELDFFRRAPEYPQLVDLRHRLRGQAVRVAELEDTGPRGQRAQRELAREMEATARDLKRLTGKLENRTDVGRGPEVRRRADKLKARADEIRDMIAKLHDLVRD